MSEKLCMYHVWVGTRGGRKKGSGPLELKSQVVVSPLMKPRSCGTVVRALNCGTISSLLHALSLSTTAPHPDSHYSNYGLPWVSFI